MKEDFKAEISKSAVKAFFTNPASYVMAFVTFASLIYAWGGLSAKKESDVAGLKKNIEEVRELVAPLKIQQDTLYKMLYRHVADQNITSHVVNEKLDEVAVKQDKLKTLVTKEFTRSMTPSQVNEMWELLEKKKSGLSLYQIPLHPPNLNLQSVSER